VARILVVDDDADIRDLLRVILERCAHEVDLVADGEAALDAAVSDPPDLVVLDLQLPRTNGWDILAALKERSEVPVLLLTGSASESDQRRARTLGADGYLTKPFRVVELRQRVGHLLGRGARVGSRAATADRATAGAAATCPPDTRGVLAGAAR
jgi:DNA-binding response OmpR family regulator